jgi:hypothetical protein
MSLRALEYVRQLRGLTTAEKLVAVLIANRFNDQKHYAWPSNQQLADDAGLTVRAVKKITHRLAEAGILLIHFGGGRGRANEYRFPAMEDADSEEASVHKRVNHVSRKGEQGGEEKINARSPQQKPSPTEKDNSLNKGVGDSSFSHSLREELKSLGLSQQKIFLVLQKYSSEVILEKLAITRASHPTSPVGFFLSALRDDYKPSKPAVEVFEEPEQETRGRASVPGKVRTFLRKLDRYMDGGIAPGQVALLAAQTGRGKTQWLTNVAANNIDNGLRVAFFTAEMSFEEILQFILGKIAKLPFRYWEDPSPNEALACAKALVRDRLQVVYLDQNHQNIVSIRRSMSSMREKGFRPDLVCIDYVGRLKSPSGEAGVYEELLTLAQHEDVPIWTAAQINREGVGKGNKSVGAAHVAGGLEKLYDVDFAITVTQTDSMLAEHKMNFYVAKARHSDGTGARFNVYTDFGPGGPNACGIFSEIPIEDEVRAEDNASGTQAELYGTVDLEEMRVLLWELDFFLSGARG